ncbi:hypothetical protein N7535_000785 [Penicillium sp. DV-2018c]|nr:hypothetical protein N7535_000785 [Penicillium sp. DV-2018c]
MYSIRSTQALNSTRRALQLTRPHVRHFHPTRPASFSTINLILDSSTAFIHGVHNISCLPWAASIPLTAVLVRTFVGLPLQIYTRLQARRENQLKVISSAWARAYMKKHAGEPPNKWRGDYHKKTVELYNRWGVSRTYRPIMFLQVPVFIALMESLRGMSGNNRGIFAWLLSLIEPAQDPASATQSLHLTVEPTFATEGALWFPDLLAGDPTGVLPALLTVSILSNVMIGWKTKTLEEMSELPKLQMYQEASFRGLRVFVQALACYVGLAGFASEMPTSLLLYWITSTNVATLQTWILENKVFKQGNILFFRKKWVSYAKPGVDDPFQLKNMR